ncbi:MAG: lipid-A-disaccharide synthase [Deltaproteobacteria bacterium]|nr:lipid-A-disaccharide synthase [Deltaproteobacteria bacterium]
MEILAIAGEPSGDTHGGALIQGLKSRMPNLVVRGVGGPQMVAAGLDPLIPFSSLQVHGLVEVLRHLPRLYRILWAIEKQLDTLKPDAVLLIDYPGFNLKVARAAKARGIPVFFYSSPQIWAWRGGRIRTIAKTVDWMIVLFPFEVEIYQKAGVKAVFLGHPLVGAGADASQISALKSRLGLTSDKPVVGLLPGSRTSELNRHLDILLAAVARLEAQGMDAHVVLPLAAGLEATLVEQRIKAAGVGVKVAPGGFFPLLAVADLAIVASGTATLQVGLAAIPFVVIYRVSPLTFWLARRLVHIRHVSMVNILAGREIVPELLQHDFTPQKVADAFLALAQNPAAQKTMRQALERVAQSLGTPGAYGRAAEFIAQKLNRG